MAVTKTEQATVVGREEAKDREIKYNSEQKGWFDKDGMQYEPSQQMVNNSGKDTVSFIRPDTHANSPHFSPKSFVLKSNESENSKDVTSVDDVVIEVAEPAATEQVVADDTVSVDNPVSEVVAEDSVDDVATEEVEEELVTSTEVVEPVAQATVVGGEDLSQEETE